MSSRTPFRPTLRPGHSRPGTALVCAAVGAASAWAQPAAPRELLTAAETARIEMVDRVSPSVVCIYDKNMRGGGSGVLIDEDGHGLTNYHVVAGLLEERRGSGGLGDGVLYELEVLGIDVTGDVAMFRLIPPKSGYRFPFAQLGDSDRVRVGDTAIAMGNPFILSEDYTPTVTMGMVTGIHRYQWGVKGNLTYSDCIQIDTPINPGNSGGPLFNLQGEVIGINGRISVNTRGRFNVGFGYAIAAKQIRRFMPAMRAGLLATHGTWEARTDETSPGEVTFTEVKPDGPAHTAGIRRGDGLAVVDGTPIHAANQVVSILGTYPANWPVTATIERDGKPVDVVVRLGSIQPKMRRPFEPNRDTAVRQIRRILREYRRTTTGVHGDAIPRRWSWTITREHRPAADGTARPCETFQVTYDENARARVRQRIEDGSPGRTVEYDARTAVQISADGGDAFDLPIDQKMILGAVHRTHEWLRRPADDIEVGDAAHVGGDAFIPRRESDVAAAAQPPDAPPRTEQVLEVLEWPVAEQASARFSFDAETSLLVRIQVRDRLSGMNITIDLTDHRDVGGWKLPGALHVYGAGHDYRDVLSDWEFSP